MMLKGIARSKRITTRIHEDLRDSPEVCTLYQTPPLLTRRTAGCGCRHCRELRSRTPRPGSTPQRCESATRAFLHTRTQCWPLLAVHSLQGLGRTKRQPPRACTASCRNRLRVAATAASDPALAMLGPHCRFRPCRTLRATALHLLGQRMHGAGKHGAGKHELLRRRQRVSRAASSQMAAPGSFSSPTVVLYGADTHSASSADPGPTDAD